MSETLIFANTAIRSAPLHDGPTVPMPGRAFADALAGAPTPVVEVLSAVKTDFRQGEASMLQLIDAALAKDAITRHELLTLRARMRRYSFEVDALGKLVEALVRGLRGEHSS